MDTLYVWDTPNGQKPIILAEELGMPYTLKPVNISKGEQFAAEYVAINPNSKIPALKDEAGFRVFESGAILVHLAEKHGRFLPAYPPAARAEVLAWTFWQVGGLGPMLGQWGHFHHAEERVPSAIERYLKESIRLLGVLNNQLATRPYIAGEEYTIADITCWTWASAGLTFLRAAEPHRLHKLGHLEAWEQSIATRPAVVRALDKLRQAIASTAG